VPRFATRKAGLGYNGENVRHGLFTTVAMDKTQAFLSSAESTPDHGAAMAD
jgi:hypothetical protein